MIKKRYDSVLNEISFLQNYYNVNNKKEGNFCYNYFVGMRSHPKLTTFHNFNAFLILLYFFFLPLSQRMTQSTRNIFL